MLIQDKLIIIYGEDKKENEKIAKEIYDRLFRLGYNLSMKDEGGNIKISNQANDKNYIKIRILTD